MIDPSEFILTSIFSGLQICANHFQMTYYLLFILFLMGIWFFYDLIKNKDYEHLGKSSLVLVFSALFALLFNVSMLLTTSEYASESTRGNYSNLTINEDGSQKMNNNGLEKEYITQWSYGVFESLNLFIPRIMGGGSSEELEMDSNFYTFLKANDYSSVEANLIIQNTPMYWGDLPFVEAPASVTFCRVLLTPAEPLTTPVPPKKLSADTESPNDILEPLNVKFGVSN